MVGHYLHVQRLKNLVYSSDVGIVKHSYILLPVTLLLMVRSESFFTAFSVAHVYDVCLKSYLILKRSAAAILVPLQ